MSNMQDHASEITRGITHEKSENDLILNLIPVTKEEVTTAEQLEKIVSNLRELSLKLAVTVVSCPLTHNLAGDVAGIRWVKRTDARFRNKIFVLVAVPPRFEMLHRESFILEAAYDLTQLSTDLQNKSTSLLTPILV